MDRISLFNRVLSLHFNRRFSSSRVVELYFSLRCLLQRDGFGPGLAKSISNGIPQTLQTFLACIGLLDVITDISLDVYRWRKR